MLKRLLASVFGLILAVLLLSSSVYSQPKVGDITCLFSDMPEDNKTECSILFFYRGPSTPPAITTSDNKTFTISGQTYSPGTPVEAELTYSYIEGHPSTRATVDHRFIDVIPEKVYLEVFTLINQQETVITTVPLSSGNYSFQLSFPTTEQQLETYLIRTVIQGSFAQSFEYSSTTFDFKAQHLNGSVRPIESVNFTYETGINNNSTTSTNWATEFGSGFLNGAKTTILGFFGAIGDVFNGLLGGLKLIGNGLVATLAGIESLFNGKSFAENYDKINIFGDAGVNASSLSKGAIIAGTTAILIGAGVLLTPIVGSTVLATAIIGASAIVLSNGIGIAVEMQQGATFGEAFKSTTCGKVDASFAYCSGNIGGQIVSGEALSFGIAKGVGFVDEVAKTRYFQSKGVDYALIRELQKSNVKINVEEVVKIGRNGEGSIVWLEKGNKSSGLEHILIKHESHFRDIGIKKAEIPDFLLEAVAQNKKIGVQGDSRDIYEVIWKGKRKVVGIDIGSNGYIVGANPKGDNFGL